MEDAEVVQVPKTEEPIILTKSEIPSTHALGLQDLYKAAFSQEPPSGFNELNSKTTIITPSLMQEPNDKFYGGGGEEKKINGDLEKPVVVYKNTNYDESYQLYTLKGLQYSVDFVKPEETTLDLNYDPTGKEGGEGLSTGLNRSFEPSFQNDADSVLDLDKGIQIQLVKTEDLGVGTAPDCNFETCEYTGDAQILHRYLCDTALLKTEESDVNPPVSALSLNFMNKQNNNDTFESGSTESVGVNPELLGVRFEDCDFNSSDSFASTESIIPKNIKCPKCPKKFMFKSDLLRHDKYKHSVRLKLCCKYCNKEFVSQLNLLFHEKSHKKKNSYKCDTCKKVFKKGPILVKHMMTEHSKAVRQCGECDKVFATQVLLNSHYRKVHKTEMEKPFKCEICLKSFEKKQGLSCHAKVHLEDQVYVCQLCNKAFSKICYLKNHQKIHANGDKEGFVCDTCGKDFKSFTALEEHNRKHTGEKPFTCNVCMKRFAYKACFNVHMKKHAEVKPYACSYCQKTFVTTADLNKHEKSHTKEKSFHCVNCNQDFSQQSQLTAHLKKQKCTPNKSQDVCTQTTDFVEGSLQNVTLQNVNVTVDSAFGIQQPIVLTSIGSFIDSNSVPVIFTQNPSGHYSVSSIT